MSLPTWDQFMIHVLQVLADGATRHRREIAELAADSAGLDDSQRKIQLNSGELTYRNRAGWAESRLLRAGALERPMRGHYRISEYGRELLARYPHGLGERDLPVVEIAMETSARPVGEEVCIELDPTEQVEQGVIRLHQAVAAELLSRLLAQNPAFFEQAVLELLMAMGYGGAEGTARHTQLTNDEGIDGIIDQDALGLSRIYVQAKRYAADRTVGRPDIQAFVGALHGQQASQGVFITTSRFAQSAEDYVRNLSTRVILIGGERLVNLMIRYKVGVQIKRTLEIVQIDEDFFD